VTTKPDELAPSAVPLDLDAVAGLSWWDRLSPSKRRLFVWLIIGWVAAAILAWQAGRYYRHENSKDVITAKGGSVSWSLFEGTTVGFPISSPTMSGEELECLKDLDRVRSLDLHGVLLTDESLACLRHLPDLKELRLGASQASISDEGLIHLRSLSHVESLELGKTQVTDSGLKSLATLKSLKSLRLESAKITSTGISELARDLPNLKYSDVRISHK
jgi:hypothetical protein